MYETDRRKIYQLADRLRLQANFWNSNEQGFADLFSHRDIKNSVDTAKREGIAEGMEKKSLEIAKKMLAKGMDEATVKEITGLSAELIQKLNAKCIFAAE